MKVLKISSKQKREVVDISEQVNQWLGGQKIKNGWCHLFITHTTAGLTTADLDPGTDEDFLDFLEAMTPKIDWRHPHDPAHTPDHLWASLIGSSLTVPVEKAKLKLGTWQRVVLVELNGPRQREVLAEIGD